MRGNHTPRLTWCKGPWHLQIPLGLAILIIPFLLSLAPLGAGLPWRGDSGQPRGGRAEVANVGLAVRPGEPQEALAAARGVAALVKGFQKYVSPVDGDRCGLYPSCSNYALQALDKHGLLMGLVMTFDRLLRESDELRLSRPILSDGTLLFDDPVSANDFWWGRPHAGRTPP